MLSKFSHPKKIKLIYPPCFDEIPGGIVPLGIAMISSYLRYKNIFVDQDDLFEKTRDWNKKQTKKLIDLNIFKDTVRVINYLHGNKDYLFDEQIQKILNLTNLEGFSIIGFSVHSSFTFLFALLLAHKIKKTTHDVEIVFGGSYITLEGHNYFDDFKFVDYFIIGKGESALEKLAKNKYSKNIPGLIFRKNDIKKINKSININIDELKIPNFESLPLSLYRHKIKKQKKIVLSYFFTQGCSNRCSFCTHYKLNKVSFKNEKKVVSELKYLIKKYNTNYFDIGDSSLNTSYSYLSKLCDTIIKQNINMKWASMIRPDNLDSKLLKKMKKAGCVYLRFGIESPNNEILRNMGKKFNSSIAQKVLVESHNAGIINEVFFITGYPHETKNEINRTVNFIKNNSQYIDYAQTNIFRIDFGSPIYLNPEKFGITNIKPMKNEFFSDIRFSFDEINGLKWEYKFKQQLLSDKTISKAIFKYVHKKKNSLISQKYTFLNFIPSSIFYYLMKNIYKKGLINKFFLNYCRILNKEYYPSSALPFLSQKIKL